MGLTTHGITQFKSRGTIDERIKGRRKLTMGLNRIERELKSAVRVNNIKSDLQISLLKYELTIVGLFTLFAEEVGMLDPGELRKHRLVPQPVFHYAIQPALVAAGRILKDLDCNVKEEDTIMTIQQIKDTIDKRKAEKRGKD